MINENTHQHEQITLTKNLKAFVCSLGVDLVGIADLSRLDGMPIGVPFASGGFLKNFRYAVVLGAQLNKLGKNATGLQVSLFMEKAAIEVLAYLEERGNPGLIVHTEDEFDPVKRIGLVSLKVLAKGAGLGWQGRSLLIINPEYGPVHRWIAVLTNLSLHADETMPNLCGECSLCIDKCPKGALTLVPFRDHPEHLEDVLNIQACLGDAGCKVCLVVCPWARKEAS